MRLATMTAVASLATSAICASAPAQESTPAPFIGAWQVTWAGENHRRQARLVLTQSGGTWKTFEPDITKTKRDKCRGLEVPVSLESVASNKLVLKLNYAATLTGCHDSKIVLIRVDDKTITGKRHGTDLTVSRE